MSTRRELAEPRRLRVPGALVVAFVGSSMAVSLWYGGCDPSTPDPTPDGGRLIEMMRDADIEPDSAIVDAANDGDSDEGEPPH